MSTTQKRMAAIFNEWARRYAENPNEFSPVLDADGNPVADYGQNCAIYFDQITAQIAADLPPRDPAINQTELIALIYRHFGRVDADDYVAFAHELLRIAATHEPV